MSDHEKVTLRIPKEDLDKLRYLVGIDDFSSVSEAVRTAVRDMIYDGIPTALDRYDVECGGRPT